MRKARLTGVILAGGQSSRMGRDKALLPLAGKPLVRHLAEEMLTLDMQRIIVACGTEERGQAYELLLQGLPGEIVLVADRYPGCGPLAGLHAALSAMPESDYAFVMACDMPIISAVLFERLREAVDGRRGIGADSESGDPLEERHGVDPARQGADGSQGAAETAGAASTIGDQLAAMAAPDLAGSSPQAVSEAARSSLPQVVLTPNQPFHALYHSSVLPELEQRLEQGDFRVMSLLNALRTTRIDVSVGEASAFINLNTPELYEEFIRSSE